MPTKFETRGYKSELRAEEDGTFEGYIAVWDTVDSYNSTFKRGAFSKTIQARFDRIKVLWNHNQEEVIGKITDIREDDHGVLVTGKLVISVAKASDVYELLKARAIDTLSFGFKTINDKWENGVRAITEVKLYEVSPVTFEANEAAVITAVRSIDFQETIDNNLMRSHGWRLMDALYETIDDIWWAGERDDQMALLDEAIAKFRDAYLTWASEAMALGIRSGASNELADAMCKYMADGGHTPLSLATNTEFTQTEIRRLMKGEPIQARDKLTALPEDIRTAHQASRSKAVETLCTELREGILPAEATRIAELATRSLQPAKPEIGAGDMVAYLTHFRTKLESQEN